MWAVGKMQATTGSLDPMARMRSRVPGIAALGFGIDLVGKLHGIDPVLLDEIHPVPDRDHLGDGAAVAAVAPGFGEVPQLVGGRLIMPG